MTLSEDTGQDAAYAHDRYRARRGRHGRPAPFGGRLRLPTLRFSGAAMAMSTVVGISIATTFLLNEQQGVGRRAGVARIGSTPPPSPDTDSGPGTSSGGGTASGGTADSTATAGRPPAAPSTPVPAPSSGAGAPGPHATAPGTPRPGGLPSGVPLAEGPAPRHGVSGESADRSPGSGGATGPGTGAGNGGGAGRGTGAGTGGDAPETVLGGRPDHPVTADEPPAVPGPGQQTARRPGEEQLPPGGSPSPSPATPAPSPSSSGPRPFFPTPGPPPGGWGGGVLGEETAGSDPDGPASPVRPGPGTTGGPDATKGPGGTDGTDGTDGDTDDHALTGAALVQPLGRDGTRHRLALTVTEPLTALQAEFRLAPGTAAPGAGTAWTDLAGAVVTTHQERGAAVYRFTTPPGTDVRPGRYTFTVLGARRPGPTARPAPGAPPRSTDPRGTDPRAAEPRAAESWSAGAFGIDRPRAVAALGTFAPPAGGPAPTVPAPRTATPAA
ncbi:hypothetical protein ACFCX4_12380 [Kitasatospora sp. NPDC056327]|uniref:hypothetical protein n=1 Tax=Kitasatospora sp. NPDC056327 TaxID=3345785 RepID=UPI0035DD77BE